MMAAATTMSAISHRWMWPRLAMTPPIRAAVSPGMAKPMNRASSAKTRAPTMRYTSTPEALNRRSNRAVILIRRVGWSVSPW
ncbi:MAG: hypothetical protein ACR2P2_06305 [Nakamurella sp.]